MPQWLVKTEPEEFSWENLVNRGPSCWDGVRNLEARNHLRAMQLDDEVFVYHTGKQRSIVGLGRVTRTAYRDPSADRAIWSAVDIEATRPLSRPVTLSEIKADARFARCPLVRRPRLSVMPLSEAETAAILELAESAHGDDTA